MTAPLRLGKMQETGLGRLFAIVDGDDPALRARRLRAFEAIFALVVGVETWLRALSSVGPLQPVDRALLAVVTPACVAIVVSAAAPAWRLRRPAFALIALCLASLLWREFPASGNHAYLELAVCLLGSLLSLDSPEEQLLELRAVRWMAVVIFFYSGLQKLVQGYYLHGEYLAFSFGSTSFRPVLALLADSGEIARLAALRGDVGDGPYRLGNAALLAASNATWILEIAIAPALCWRRTRSLAVGVALAFLLGIEAAAREAFFGLVFADAILLFARRDQHARALPLVAALLALLALIRLGIVPEVTFH